MTSTTLTAPAAEFTLPQRYRTQLGGEGYASIRRGAEKVLERAARATGLA